MLPSLPELGEDMLMEIAKRSDPSLNICLASKLFKAGRSPKTLTSRDATSSWLWGEALRREALRPFPGRSIAMIVITGAALRGDVSFLEHAWEICDGLKWHNANSRVTEMAARGGHLEVLQWAREHGCPWHKGTTYAAAFWGHLEVLQWVREHGCPWHEWTTCAAAREGHLDVLQWVVDNGCLWHEDACDQHQVDTPNASYILQLCPLHGPHRG